MSSNKFNLHIDNEQKYFLLLQVVLQRLNNGTQVLR